VDDLRNPEIRPYLDRYLRGSNGYSAVDRSKVMKLLWDAIGSEFAGRHELYERSHAGNPEENRIQVLRKGAAGAVGRGMLDLVDACLSDYDLNGWSGPDLLNPPAR
jgi:4-hydroxyphenylacetate 3-monooxygenase